MTPRYARLWIALMTAVTAGACKKQPDAPAAPPVAPVVTLKVADATAAADPWAKAPAPKDPLPHPLFWSIEKDGHTTYLLGTMHIGVDPETRLPAIVWTKLDEAKTFAMETDLSDPSLVTMATRSDGGSLHAELGDAYWKKLQEALTPPMANQVDKMKPMVAASMLSMRGIPETAPMDGVLLGRATNEHKAIVFLEPPQKQEAILEKWMDDRALKEMLDDLTSDEEHTKEMLDAYVAGDDAKILTLSNMERADFKKQGRTDAEYDQQMEDLLYERNASWIDEIDKLHTAGGGFIAVGAMHLIGPRSVLDLLAHKGYRVTRITP